MQTPAPFEYERATSVEGAVASLQRLGSDARIIAGGHSLLPMMKLRLAKPKHLIDINDLSELSYIREEARGTHRGALTRHVQLQRSDVLARHFPLFRDAEDVIADPVVRNRGTIGGSLCQADAAEDLCRLRGGQGEAVIRGADGERVVEMEDFHVGPYQTAVGDGEMLTRCGSRCGGGGSAHEKVERSAGDWAIVAASAAVWIENGEIADAGLALTAVGLTTIHLSRAEELLRGKAPSDESCSGGGRDRLGGLLTDGGRSRAGGLQAASRGRARARALSRASARARARRPDHERLDNDQRRTGLREIEPRQLLVHFIRETPDLTGTHWGCDTSNCGACVVLMDGETVKSCTILAAMCEVTRSARSSRSRSTAGWIRSSWASTSSTASSAVLHAGDADGSRAARREPGSDGARDPHRDLGRHLPLHGLQEHRRSRALGRRARSRRETGGVSMTTVENLPSATTGSGPSASVA